MSELTYERAKQLYTPYDEDQMCHLCALRDVEIERLRAENDNLREGLAVSIPLPLDGNSSAIHPDDIIGSNVGGTDFFGRVTEMHLTRYPRDGQPAVWVVKTEDDDGNVAPYVCWGGRCHAVHKKASQTYSAEYLETYEENKQLKAENAKLRKLASELYQQVLQDDAAWHDVRAWEDGLPSDCLHPIRSYDDSLGKHAVAPKFEQRMRELGVES